MFPLLGSWEFCCLDEELIKLKKEENEVMATINGYQSNTPVAAPSAATATKQSINPVKTVDSQSVLKRFFLLNMNFFEFLNWVLSWFDLLYLEIIEDFQDFLIGRLLCLTEQVAVWTDGLNGNNIEL